MTKAQAKRRAYWAAATILQSAFDAGWEYDNNLTEADGERFYNAMQEIILQLERKGMEKH